MPEPQTPLQQGTPQQEMASDGPAQKGRVQSFLTMLFIVVFVFAIFVALSNVSFSGLTGFTAMDLKNPKSNLSITPQEETLVLKSDNVKQCCIFPTDQGPKRCAVVGTQDCSECAKYCT